MKQSNTLGVVLSGGAGSRLDGVDKGLQWYEGRRLVEHVIHALNSQTNHILICANRNIDAYQALGFTVVEDHNQGRFEGPLAGISSAVDVINNNEHLDHIQQLLIAPCDAPALPKDYYQRLSAANSNVAVVHDGHRKQNLHCLINRQQWASLQAFYTDGGRAIHRWFKQVNAVEVDFSDKTSCFKNINTPDDLLVTE